MRRAISIRIFDPETEIISPDLSVTSAAMRLGGDLLSGEIATIEVSFVLDKSVAQLAIALRLYDKAGRCAFASSLKEYKEYCKGSHKVVFYFVCMLPYGQYAASFEFAELLQQRFVKSQQQSGHIELSYRWLGLNNLFVEFEVKNVASTRLSDSAGFVDQEQDDEFAQSGYAQLPLEVVSFPEGKLDTENFRQSSKKMPRFDLTGQGRLFSKTDMLDGVHNVLHSALPENSKSEMIAISQVIGAHESPRVFKANELNMKTEVGELCVEGVKTTKVAGRLLFGPHLPVTSGRYQIAFVGTAHNGSHNLNADVVALRGNKLLGNAPLCTVNEGTFRYQFNIDIDEPGQADLEIRLWVDNYADLLVNYLEIVALDVSRAQVARSLQSAVRLADWIKPSDELFVYNMFTALLGRLPSCEDLDFFKKMPMMNLVCEVAKSAEHSFYVLNSFFRDEIKFIYRNLLNRDPSKDELNGWIEINKKGTSDARKFITKSMCFVYNEKLLFTSADSDNASFVFVYIYKKDKDSLEKISEALKSIDNNMMVSLVSLDEAMENYFNFKTKNTIYVTAIDLADLILRSSGFVGRFVYMEHGVAPLKAYTYADHYRRYDYALLPGDLWTERLERLYPELKGRLFAVGYPKLTCKTVSKKDRKDYARRHGLDAAKPIVLFAPTWSGDDPERGINNIKYLTGLDNLIAIPHEGDLHLVNNLKTTCGCIHVMTEGETISDHYSYADLLISDVSSTAIEFARLGKPVVCIKLANIPDYDHSFMHPDGVPGIPHTDYRWDFCQMVEASEVVDAVVGILGSAESTVISAHASELVRKMCSSYGNESLNQTASVLMKIASMREEKHV